MNLPLVQYSIVIEGGHMLDNVDKAGVANLVATMMNEGTKNKTPEQLEEAIGLLGASIRVSSGNEDISIDVRSLARNFEKLWHWLKKFSLSHAGMKNNLHLQKAGS